MSPREDESSNIWVLDTHTKGTGANMVPLDRVLRHGSDSVPGFILPQRRPHEEPSAEPKAPYRFKVVDVMTRQVLAEDVDARGAVEALRRQRSIVDVTIYVYDVDAERWRRLTHGEAKALWQHRAVD